MKTFLVHRGDDFICLINSTSIPSAKIKLDNLSFDTWFNIMEDEDIDESEYLYNKRNSFNIVELPIIL